MATETFKRWTVRWDETYRLNGRREHFCDDWTKFIKQQYINNLPALFNTRKECHWHIAETYGLVGVRIAGVDPPVWMVPVPVHVCVSIYDGDVGG